MTSPAGGASAAQGGDAAQNGQANGDGDAAQQGGVDLSALAEQIGGTNESLEQMRQFLQSQPWVQQEQQQAELEPAQPEPIDLAFLDDALGVDQEAATQLAGVFERQVKAQVEAAKREWQQQHQALTERVTERERMEQMRDLVDEFPDMADPDVAKPIVQQAQALADAHGWSPEWAADPRAWRLTYMAQQSVAAAQEEGREDSQAAHLEGGAGASGAQTAKPGDDFKQMLDEQAQTGRRALGFP